MVKRVFKIIGIVLASVTAFTGAVLGVMAAMGKFKTPIVFPDRLEFVDSEQTIVFDEDTATDDTWYSFTLNGFSDSGNQVNQKNCYIYFEGNVGADLITLYDKNKNLLTPTNNRYLIECDEPVYYQVKKDIADSHFDKTNFGKVSIKARDEKNQIQSNTLTIWIDRAVTNINIVTDRGDNGGALKNGTEEITLGLDAVQTFEFYATPDHSLRPISNLDAKEIEIYYNDATQTDYVRIDDNSVNTYSFLNKVDEKYVFSTDVAGTYEFIAAVFATYEKRDTYINEPNNATNTNFERIAQMVSKRFKINVVNTDIGEVVFGAGSVGLDLYSNNNYITLNGVSGVDNARDNNLQLIMKDNKNVYTDIRFNEIIFNTSDDNYTTKNICFGNVDDEKDIELDINYSINKTNDGNKDIYTFVYKNNNYIINLDDKVIYNQDSVTRTIIKSLTNGEKTYTSTNDIVVLTKTSNAYSLERLISGSYLGFYEVDAYDNYSQSTLKYTVKSPINSGDTKSWNIIIEEKPDSDVKLKLGLLVVNNSGSYKFASVNTEVNVVDLSYEFESNNYNLDVTYNQVNNEYVTSYGEVAVADIVNITAGSYTACVFVTPKVDGENAKYDIDVLENVVYTDNNEHHYVLVGYLDKNNKFVNTVRLKEGATNADTKIYMLQLRNDYKQLSNEVIDEIIKEDKALSDYLVSSYLTPSKAITINANYSIKQSDVSSRFDSEKIQFNEIYYVNEGTTDCVLYFESENVKMLQNLLNVSKELTVIARLYDNEGKIFIPNSSYITFGESPIDSYESKGLKITFNVGDFYKEDYYLTIVLTYNGIELESVPLYVKSTAPSDINVVYKDGSDRDIYLDIASDEQNVSENPYIKILVGYDITEEKYTYEYYLMSGNTSLANTESIADNKLSVFANRGWFIVEPNLDNVTHTITFASRSNSIFTIDSDASNLEVIGLGNTVMKLESRGVTRFIKVVVVQDNNFTFAEKSSADKTSTDSSFTFSSLVDYKYNSTTNFNINSTYVKAEMSIQSSGVGQLKVVTDTTNNIQYAVLSTYDGTEYGSNYVLKLYSDTANGWTLERKDDYLHNTFSVKVTLSTLTHQNDDKLTLTLDFTSSVAVDINSRWYSDYVYAGTKVLLTEEYTTATYEEENTPIFLLKNQQGSVTFSIEIKEKPTDANPTIIDDKDGTLKVIFDKAGTYKISFKKGETLVAERSITVIPNAIYISHRDELISDSQYALLDNGSNNGLLSIKSFDTSVTYGLKAGTVTPQYVNSNNEYTSYLSTDITTDSNISISASVAGVIDATAKTSWISEVNATKSCTINVNYSGYTIASDLSIIVSNVIKTTKDAPTLMATEPYDVASYFAFTKYATTDTIVVTDVSNIELFSVTSGKLVYNSHIITDEMTINNVTLTFSYAGTHTGTLTWTGDIIINPYNTASDTPSETIYSENTYSNFLSLFFSTVDSSKIKEIKFENADIVGNVNVIEFENVNNGTSYNTTANIGAISAPQCITTIKISIIYANNLVYTYHKDVTIYNRQTLTLHYPFEDLSTTTANYKIANFEDAFNIDNTLIENSNMIYSFSNKSYEPVLVGQTIDFASSAYLRQRTTIIDHLGGTDISIASIEIVGYQNKSGLGNALNFTNSNSSITFNVSNAFSAGSSLYVILKITTNTGYFDYYFINLYNNNSGIASTLNQKNITGNDYKLETTAPKYIEGSGSSAKLFNGTSGTKLDSTFFNQYGVNISYSSNINTFLLSAVDINGTSIVNSDDLYNIVTNKQIPDSTQYYKVTLGFVYLTYDTTFYIGSITINVQPKINENVKQTTDKDGNTISVVDKYENGHNTGEYSKVFTINDIDDNGFANPFSISEYSFIEAKQVGEITDLITLDTDGKLYVSPYPTTNVEFIVQYGYGEAGDVKLSLNVHYTLTGFTFDDSDKSYTVGTYSTDNASFNNTLAFDTIVSGYNKGYTWEVTKYNNEAVTDTPKTSTGETAYEPLITHDSGTFTFTQGTAQYTVMIKLTMTGLTGSHTKTIQVTVLPNISAIQTSGTGSGKDTSEARETIATNDYSSETSAIGSTLTIGKEDIKDTPNSKFIIAGLTIIVPNGSKLDISTSGRYNNTVENEKYIVNYNNLNDISTVFTINFYHSINNNVIIPLTIKVKDGSGSYYQTTDIYGNTSATTYTIYVKVCKTYDCLEARYVLNGATYETIQSNGTISDLLTNNLFATLSSSAGETTPNASRIYLKVNDNTILGIGDFSAERMGFIGRDNSNNPNYINVVTSSYLTYSGDTLTASEVTEITNTKISLETISGNYLCDYIYHILPNNDLLTYADDMHGTIGGSQEYASIRIDDADTTKKFTYTKAIGELIDDYNTIFYAKIIDSTTSDSSVLATREEDPLTNNVTYSFERNDYKFKIIYDNTANQISLDISREKDGNIQGKYIFNTTIYLEGGGVYSLRIVIFNAKVYSDYSDVAEDIYAAETSINLSESNRLVVKENATTGSTLTYSLLLNGSSYYNISGTKYNISNAENSIYKYDSSTKSLTTRAVGMTVKSVNTFRVEADGYYLGDIVYKMNIIPNLKFRLSPEGSTEIEWYSDTKEISYTFKEKDSTSTTRGDNLSTTSGFLYTLDLINDPQLKLGLYAISNNAALTTSQAKVRINETVAGVSISGLKLLFTRDFTGELDLELYVHTDNGEFAVGLVINITGFTTLTYTGLQEENSILITDGGEAFLSGKEVNIVNSSKSEGVGIAMSWQYSGSTPVEYKKFSVNFTAKYAITDDSATIDADAINSNNFTDLDIAYTVPTKVALIIPNVPESSSPNWIYYLVTVKLTLHYRSETTDIYTQDYYVTYRVYNNLSLTLNTDNDINKGIKVDGNGSQLFTTATTGDTPITNYYLAMAYMDEIYQATSASETLKFVKYLDSDGSKGVIKLKVYEKDGTLFKTTPTYTLTQSTTNTDIYTTTITETTGEGYSQTTTTTIVTLTFSSDKITRSVKVGTEEAVVVEFAIDTAKCSKTSKNDKTLFITSTTSIEMFKNYINGIDSIQFANMSGYNTGYTPNTPNPVASSQAYPYYNSTNGTLNFKLEHIQDGIWGIKLGDSQGNSKLFNNKLLADINIISAGEAINTISAYNGSSGFRLYTDNAISTNRTTKLSKMFIEPWFSNTTYFKESIIGVVASSGNPDAWTSVTGENASGTKIDNSGSAFTTISVPSGAGSHNTYSLYKRIYTNGAGDLYTLTAEFFYIETDSATIAKIVVPDYSVSIELDTFKVSFDSRNTSQSFDLTNKFISYSMVEDTNDGSKLKLTPSKNTGAVTIKELSTSIYDDEDIHNTNGNNISIISIPTSWLQTYKNNNPTKTYITMQYTATYDAIAVLFNVEFMLPTDITMGTTATNNMYELEYSESEDIDINLTKGNKIYYREYADDGTYTDTYLTAETLSNFTIQLPRGTQCTLTNGVISIEKTELDSYKTAHSSATYYEEEVDITYNSQTITITVRFELPKSAA